MNPRHPSRAVLCVAGLLIGLTSINVAAVPGSLSGEGEDVRILNAFTDNPVIAGSQLRYTLMVFVNGAGPVTDLTITLPMPAGTGMVSVEGPGGATCNAPAVGANGSISCTWPVTFGTILSTRMLHAAVSVPLETPTGTLLSTTISATANESDPDPSNNSVTLASTVLAAGDQHVSVPTLGQGGLILLSLGIGLLGMMAASRRQA